MIMADIGGRLDVFICIIYSRWSGDIDIKEKERAEAPNDAFTCNVKDVVDMHRINKGGVC